MRIATYNVWNENKGIGNRLDRVEIGRASCRERV